MKNNVKNCIYLNCVLCIIMREKISELHLLSLKKNRLGHCCFHVQPPTKAVDSG